MFSLYLNTLHTDTTNTIPIVSDPGTRFFGAWLSIGICSREKVHIIFCSLLRRKTSVSGGRHPSLLHLTFSWKNREKYLFKLNWTVTKVDIQKVSEDHMFQMTDLRYSDYLACYFGLNIMCYPLLWYCSIIIFFIRFIRFLLPLWASFSAQGDLEDMT